MAEQIPTIIPHADFGAPECCGCLLGIVHRGQARIICNECMQIVKRVAPTDLQRTLDEMELSLDVASAICLSCRAVNLFPGLSRVEAFVCHECGAPNG